MNNYKEIQFDWDMMDQARYPHLFDWTVNMIREGTAKGEKVMR